MIYNLAGLALDLYLKTSRSSFNEAEKQGVDSMQQELKKQEIKAKYEMLQTKIAQEYAIAKKIEEADEVRIEEYYDLNGKTNIGLHTNKSDGDSISNIELGASINGQKISKRVFYFKKNIENVNFLEKIKTDDNKELLNEDNSKEPNFIMK